MPIVRRGLRRQLRRAEPQPVNVAIISAKLFFPQELPIKYLITKDLAKIISKPFVINSLNRLLASAFHQHTRAIFDWMCVAFAVPLADIVLNWQDFKRKKIVLPKARAKAA